MTILGFSGGEIFCHPEVYEIMERASSRHRTVLVTNGTMFRIESIPRLIAMGARNLWSRGLVRIGISVNEEFDGEEQFKALLKKKIQVFDRLSEERRHQGKRLPQFELKIPIRENTAPYLDEIATAVQDTSIEAVTFQVLTSQAFCCFLGLDPTDRTAIESFLSSKEQAPEPIPFRRIEALRTSLSRLASLPRSTRNSINFLPAIPESDVLAYYEGRMDLSKFRCTSPWIHWMIDPAGIAFHCIHPEGINLNKEPFLAAWSDPRMRAFRREIRDRRVFPCCTGCCFITHL